jgi:hypothetical protein
MDGAAAGASSASAAAPGGGSSGSLSTPLNGGQPGAGSGAAGGGGGSAAASGASSSGASSGGGSVAPAGGSTAVGRSVAVAPSAPIVIGIPYVNQQEENAVTGGIGSGLQNADDQAMFSLLISDVNRHGGVLGHPLQAVYHSVDPTQTEAQWEQSACSDFVQDHHVLVAFRAATTINYLKCVTQGGAAVIGTDWSNLVQSEYQQLQWVIQPDTFALDRLARIQATQFEAEGLFASPAPAKVGILYFDVPEFATAEGILEHSLAAEGVDVVDRQAFNWVGSTQDVGGTAARVQNAWLIGFFGLDAANQNYYPRYGYTSDEVLSNIAANVPAKALQGSKFIGWWPAQDLADTGDYPPAEKACVEFMNAHGQATSTGNERSSALGDCESIYYLVAALKAGGEPFSRASLLAGARRLTAASYQPVNTFGISETPSNFDGASEIRQGGWDTSCSCFAYTSGPIKVN